MTAFGNTVQKLEQDLQNITPDKLKDDLVPVLDSIQTDEPVKLTFVWMPEGTQIQWSYKIAEIMGQNINDVYLAVVSSDKQILNSEKAGSLYAGVCSFNDQAYDDVVGKINALLKTRRKQYQAVLDDGNGGYIALQDDIYHIDTARKYVSLVTCMIDTTDLMRDWKKKIIQKYPIQQRLLEKTVRYAKKHTEHVIKDTEQNAMNKFLQYANPQLS